MAALTKLHLWRRWLHGARAAGNHGLDRRDCKPGIEPDPRNDGIWFMGFRVTNPTTGVWHYETRSIIRIWIAPSNLSPYLLDPDQYHVASGSMRRLNNPPAPTMGRRGRRSAIAAPHGLLLKPQARYLELGDFRAKPKRERDSLWNSL